MLFNHSQRHRRERVAFELFEGRERVNARFLESKLLSTCHEVYFEDDFVVFCNEVLLRRRYNDLLSNVPIVSTYSLVIFRTSIGSGACALASTTGSRACRRASASGSCCGACCCCFRRCGLRGRGLGRRGHGHLGRRGRRLDRCYPPERLLQPGPPPHGCTKSLPER